MKKYWIILAGLLLTACKSLPEPQVDIEGLSFTKFGGQEAVVFENRNDINVIYGNTESGEVFKFSNGSWLTKAPNFNWLVKPDSSYDNKLVFPMKKGFSFVFLLKNEAFPRAFLDQVTNPCNAGDLCPWPGPIPIPRVDFMRTIQTP